MDDTLLLRSTCSGCERSLCFTDQSSRAEIEMTDLLVYVSCVVLSDHCQAPDRKSSGVRQYVQVEIGAIGLRLTRTRQADGVDDRPVVEHMREHKVCSSACGREVFRLRSQLVKMCGQSASRYEGSRVSECGWKRDRDRDTRYERAAYSST